MVKDNKTRNQELFKGKFKLALKHTLDDSKKIQRLAGEEMAFYLHKNGKFMEKIKNHRKEIETEENEEKKRVNLIQGLLIDTIIQKERNKGVIITIDLVKHFQKQIQRQINKIDSFQKQFQFLMSRLEEFKEEKLKKNTDILFQTQPEELEVDRSSQFSKRIFRQNLLLNKSFDVFRSTQHQKWEPYQLSKSAQGSLYTPDMKKVLSISKSCQQEHEKTTSALKKLKIQVGQAGYFHKELMKTSKTLSDIDGVDPQIISQLYLHKRQERANKLAEAKLVSREFMSSSMDPQRLVLRWEQKLHNRRKKQVTSNKNREYMLNERL